MSRGQSKLLKILISLFALNSITIFLYFSFHHHHRLPPAPSFSDVRHLLPLISNRHFLPTPTLSPPHTPPSNSNSTPHSYLKPWPILPSYLPWTRNPNPADFRSCEAYFGNGFTRRVDVLPPVTDTRGWFRCFFSQTLLSSVCEGGRIRMLPDKIVMSRGGETLNEVIGRDENDEMPVFQSGAFQVLGSSESRSIRRLRRNQKLVNDMFLGHYLPEGEIGRHTMRQLVSSIEVVDDREFQCDQWIEEPALLVTRFEYANLFHTVTDWYSSYVASKVTDLPYRPHLVFVDGHCRGAPGPDLWKNPDDKKTARLSEFGEMIRAAFHFPVNRHGAEKPAWGHNILFIRREDYLAHPRHDGKVQSRLSNEEEVFDAVLKWASDHKECKVNIVNGLFAHMAMKQQVKAIQEASVIIGAHGAGLTHIVSATPKTVILEIVSAEFRRPHFQLIAQWKGLEYHAIYLEESHADPVVVISRLGRIMKSLEC
ncbi:XYLT [Linum grandiflorum]